MLSMYNLMGGTQSYIEDDDNSTSKADIRKSNKPIMEKRRRARINTCLNELKGLILDALKKDPSRHNKLEKADILEMTVKHLQAVQRQQLAVAVAQDPSVLNKFKGGFADCAQEVSRYVSRVEGVDNGVRQRLIRHLNGCVSGLVSMTPLTFTAMAGVPMNVRNPQRPVQDPNNNSQLLHRLVAARLAAAGDTTGATMVLQGGVSMLAKATEPDVLARPQNEEACSSKESHRVSAFTAVKRATSPNTSFPKIIQPTAIRPVPRKICPEETLVKAQVAVQHINNFQDKPIEFPLVFPHSYKRPAESSTNERPNKVPKIEPLEVAPPVVRNHQNLDDEDKDMWRPW